MKQKDYVVEQVKLILGSRFTPFQTNALLTLSKDELELLKDRTCQAIVNKNVEYGGLVGSTYAEVNTYARSMVMNHLKKCQELNGNLSYSAGKATKAVSPVAPKGIVISVLPEDLATYVRSLV